MKLLLVLLILIAPLAARADQLELSSNMLSEIGDDEKVIYEEYVADPESRASLHHETVIIAPFRPGCIRIRISVFTGGTTIIRMCHYENMFCTGTPECHFYDGNGHEL